MRATLCLVLSVSFACGGKNTGADVDSAPPPDACVGVECNIVDCAAMSLPPTRITGTVFAPNGTLPLNGVSVYVPRDPLPAFVEGATCDRCVTTLPGSPVVQTVSDAAGNFQLDNVPIGDFSLVVTTGKWRREVPVIGVAQCTTTAVAAAQTRLPKDRSEGSIPKIAITTGGADTLECLVRKLGVESSEIGKTGDDRRIHLYSGNGTSSFAAGFAGGSGAIPSATPFWGTVDSLKVYDIVILSCEGAQNPGTKQQSALNAMKAYADLGGRVFASHWHNMWIGGNFEDNNATLAPAVWNTIGTWGNNADFNGTASIDEVSNPKGTAFANWMLNVMGTATPAVRGEFPITEGRQTSLTIEPSRAERWVTRKGQTNPQMFQFTTPNEAEPDARCGKVVFTDMHVSGAPADPVPAYPDNCIGGANNLTLTPQEKALAFMFFDIASCVGGLF